MHMNNHKKIDYVEFPSTNLEASKSFFSTVFNWTFKDFGPEYTAFSHAGLDGGFFKSEQNANTANGSALIVFYSTTLEETQSEIVAAGGTICKEIFTFQRPEISLFRTERK